MSWNEFQEECRGCRPAIMDVKTGRVYADDSPIMKAILGVWDKATPEEKQAYHRITCQNSRADKDLETVAPLLERLKEVIDALPGE